MKGYPGMQVSYRFISIDEECCNIASSSVDDDISLSPSPQHPSCFNLLQQFYDDLMIPTFASSQRDDINDWYECFRMQIKLHGQRIYKRRQQDIKDALTNGLQEEGVASKIQQFAYYNDIEEELSECNPVMDVILMVVDDKGAEENSKHHIIGGAVVEYYKQSRVGLLSYIVLHSQYRGNGLAKPLHDEALSRLEVLANNQGTDNKEGESSSQNNNRPKLQAIFAETNTVAAGDVTPDQCLIRHKSLYNLGYRLVHFPYAQPPLSTKDMDASFNDIVLLVYLPIDVDQPKQNDNIKLIRRYCQWFLEKDIETNNNSQTAQMNVEIPFNFIEEFYQVLFCLNIDDGLPDYRTSKYYCLAKRFSAQNRLVDVSLCKPSIPFEDCKETLLVEHIESS